MFLATANPGKARELRQLLPSFVITTLEDRSLQMPEETGETFEANALIKAEYAQKVLGLPVIADDSGLAVNALGGAPGVRSARYIEGTDRDRYLHLLRELGTTADRSAQFVCAMAFVYPGGKSVVTHGICRGWIAHEPSGDQGFGYDPVFIPENQVHDGEPRTMAMMSNEEKNAISHRWDALRALVPYLEAFGLVSSGS